MNNFWENKYYNSYYYSNIVDNILTGDIELIGFISNFFSNEETIFEIIKPFQVKSAFHLFIHYMIGEFFEEDMNKYDQKIFKYHKVNAKLDALYAERPLKTYGLEYSFKDFIGDKSKIEWTDIEKYHEELMLTGYLEELYEKISKEVFYILFNNRKALLRFNYIVSIHLEEIDLNSIENESTKKLFSKKGFLKRVSIPIWCKKAAYFRDRGRCCFCGKDLSNLFTLNNVNHFDHIVPLALGGLNDVSNIQLLCSGCNQKKNKYTLATSDFYEAWY